MLGAFSDALLGVEDFINRVSNASGFKAKFKVAFTGIKGAAQDVWDEFADLITGTSQAKPLKLKSGKIIEWEAPAAGLAKQIQEGIKSTDWASVGKTIGDNITSKVKITAEFLGTMLDAAYSWVDAHSEQIGGLGLKLLLELVAKMTDPEFWRENWKLILAVAISVFPAGKIGTLGKSIGGWLARPLVQFFKTEIGRLPVVFRVILEAIGAGIKTFAVGAWNTIRTQFAKVPGLLRAAFRLSAVLAFWNGLKGIFNQIKSAVTDMANWIRDKVRQIPSFLQPVRAAFFTVLGPIQLIIAAIQRMIDWIGRIPSPGDVLGGIKSTLGKFAPEIATGGTISRTGLAVVHRGETVTPAGVVNRGGASSGSSGPGQFALVWAGPDFIRWMREQDRRSRMGGSLA